MQLTKISFRKNIGSQLLEWNTKHYLTIVIANFLNSQSYLDHNNRFNEEDIHWLKNHITEFKIDSKTYELEYIEGDIDRTGRRHIIVNVKEVKND